MQTQLLICSLGPVTWLSVLIVLCWGMEGVTFAVAFVMVVVALVVALPRMLLWWS